MMANGPSGPAMSDSRSLTSGVVVLPDGIRLPATSAHGNKYLQNGLDQSALRRLGGPWEAPSMKQIKNGRWAYDSTHIHYKRAKPTQTDPEDDRNADPSLPMGSTSKTYDPRKDGSFWKRKDSGQEWSYSS